eukprot:TRINITY_DN10006_c0_g1_i1.p1 TRINITY_DN10006_c0_g1~~TRINITY_DN10006_c0_g1_i1.p1  ORF type:complete len:230 (-),score=59.30 TRINITY_DN10006_c0_g1_i1:80-769(-)
MQTLVPKKHIVDRYTCDFWFGLPYVLPKTLFGEQTSSNAALVETESNSYWRDVKSLAVTAVREALTTAKVISDFGEARVILRDDWNTHVVYNATLHEEFHDTAWRCRPIVVVMKEWKREDLAGVGLKEKKCFDMMPTDSVPHVLHFVDLPKHKVSAFVFEAGIPLQLAPGGGDMQQLLIAFPTAWKLFDAVVGLLEALSAKGIIHGDIKPSNLVLLLNERLALIDFPDQ